MSHAILFCWSTAINIKLDHNTQQHLHNYSGLPSLEYNHYIIEYSFMHWLFPFSAFLRKHENAFGKCNIWTRGYSAATWHWFGLKINGYMYMSYNDMEEEWCVIIIKLMGEINFTYGHYIKQIKFTAVMISSNNFK